MDIVAGFRSFIVATMLTFIFSGQVSALTVYDVIQLSNKGYSDQDIITLIEATDSAFELKAQDVLRLAELRVSETVIQSMLKAMPSGKPSTFNAIPPAQGLTPANQHDPAIISKITVRDRFNTRPFEEVSSGAHHHQAVTLSGINLFILRHEGQYPSISARANAVVDRLEDAVTQGKGSFRPIHENGIDTVVFYGREPLRNIIIVSITQQDARAYQQRSGRRVTPELLASYWSDLLSDYWSVAITGEPPTRLTRYHEGEALQALYESLTTSGGTDAVELADALKSFPRQEFNHLSKLATTIPREFDADSPHIEALP